MDTFILYTVNATRKHMTKYTIQQLRRRVGGGAFGSGFFSITKVYDPILRWGRGVNFTEKPIT